MRLKFDSLHCDHTQYIIIDPAAGLNYRNINFCTVKRPPCQEASSASRHGGYSEPASRPENRTAPLHWESPEGAGLYEKIQTLWNSVSCSPARQGMCYGILWSILFGTAKLFPGPVRGMSCGILWSIHCGTALAVSPPR